MQVAHPVLVWFALVVGGALGPRLAVTAARLATRDEAATPGRSRGVAITVLVAALVTGAVLLGGFRPATVGLAWVAAAGVVLGAVDLASHRLPDRVTYPAYAVCSAALLADAAVHGTWTALVRALVAAAAAFAVAAGTAAITPDGLGFGDVKLLGLLGLVLGWFGWGVLLAGIFLGLLTGTLTSVVLVALRRAGWRTALPFGPPLLVGAVLALGLAGPGALG
ncbi:prepilin peptidase [Blastococcus mobilis]|uniref:Leader peptidase (Prepilin peptidase) / N-methyltransferase n=1 Tax=Blastococcus mobilis TaxID=1938746 RepID=A0A238Z3Y4_9ACTN|nr:A24 family peptidase [Blastococcus mobilis]SNR77942.1 leader peptidase (prepilin peptidase) / N-methyltransferase [Blastococcus mobilis]